MANRQRAKTKARLREQADPAVDARLRTVRGEDPRYYLIVRAMPTIYSAHTLDGATTLDDALERARTSGQGFLRCLDAPSGTLYWLGKRGELLSTSGPTHHPKWYPGCTRIRMP